MVSGAVGYQPTPLSTPRLLQRSSEIIYVKVLCKL